MADKKIIYAEDLLMAIRDDPNINGTNFARVKAHIETAQEVTFATDNNVGCKWIPVTERLPKEFEDILVYSGGDVEPGWLGCDGFFYSYDKYESDTIYDVTHWMPLPEPPKP